MKILLTNDDGVNANGIKTLYEHLAKDHDVIICAPEAERSGSSKAVTLHAPIRVQEVTKNIYAVSGTPVDAVIIGLHHLYAKMPDLVVSGINAGPNLGEDIFYSGTVAGAFEAYVYGVPAIAISLISGADKYFDQVAKKITELINNNTFGNISKLLLNFNFPPLPSGQVDYHHFQVTRLGNRVYTDIVEVRTDPKGKPYYWIAGQPVEIDAAEGTDIWAIKHGLVSVTPIHSDVTDYKMHGELTQLFKEHQ